MRSNKKSHSFITCAVKSFIKGNKYYKSFLIVSFFSCLLICLLWSFFTVSKLSRINDARDMCGQYNIIVSDIKSEQISKIINRKSITSYSVFYGEGSDDENVDMNSEFYNIYADNKFQENDDRRYRIK